VPSFHTEHDFPLDKLSPFLLTLPNEQKKIHLVLLSCRYRFSIVNLTKPDSLYKEGMRPLMYSTTDATNNNVGWQRCGDNIAYFRNDDNNIYSTRNYHQVLMDDFDDDDSGNICSYTLTFQVEFQHENDTVYFAHSYPYTYSDLQDYLMNIQRHPVKSKFCKLRLLCRSVAGNNVYYLTVTAPSTPEEEVQKVKRRTLYDLTLKENRSSLYFVSY
jgi:cytosolic carboxypeptidase protein 2/3